MANKQSFTPEEWTKVMESVMMAGVASPPPSQAACGAP